MISRLINKFFPKKIWGIAAAENTGRGKCYTLLVGRFLMFSMPAGMMYEKNRDGTKNRELLKIIIL